MLTMRYVASVSCTRYWAEFSDKAGAGVGEGYCKMIDVERVEVYRWESFRQ